MHSFNKKVNLSMSPSPSLTEPDYNREMQNIMPGELAGLTPADVAACGQPVLLYNATYRLWMFVSNDKRHPDNVVESHPYRDEARNQFVLQPVGGANRYRLYNPDYNHWLFVSNDKDGIDHQVESHPYSNEDRNTFEFQDVGNGEYLIYNPSYREYLFVSNSKKGIDNLVQSHPYMYRNEERNRFSLQLLHDAKVIHLEYNIPQAIITKPPVPFVISTKTLRNASDVTQKISVQVNKAVSQSNSFQHKQGVKLTAGFTFNAGVPGIVNGQAKVETEMGEEFVWGEEKTITKIFSSTFTLKGQPHKETVGEVLVQQSKMEVPYKMTLKTHSGKLLYSNGIWKGVSHWNLQFDVTSRPL